MRNPTIPPKPSGPVRAAAVLIMLLCANVALSTPASAAKVMFGTREHLQKIQDTDLRGPNGERLYLGYKYSHHAFIAPYRTTDDGYILGIVGEQRYYPLDAALIGRLQAQGRLPDPLPPYSLSVWDYLFGHLLWIILAGVGISLVFAARGQRRHKQAVPFAEAGLAQQRAGNLAAAIDEYGKALALHPKFADVLMLRGDAYKAQGHIDRAIADYSKIIAADPKNAAALVARGAALEVKGLVPRAIDDYTRAIKASKASVAYFMRANAHLRGGDASAAIRDFTSAIDKNNDFAAAYRNRALAHEHIGRADLAQADYQQAVQLSAASQIAQPA